MKRLVAGPTALSANLTCFVPITRTCYGSLWQCLKVPTRHAAYALSLFNIMSISRIAQVVEASTAFVNINGIAVSFTALPYKYYKLSDNFKSYVDV